MSTRKILCTAFSWVAIGASAAAPTTDLESRLLAEPMWLLLDADGASKQVWFERRSAGLQMVRCADSAACVRPATVSGPSVRVQGFDAPIPVWPARPAGPMTLVPAWVVPVSTSRSGH